MWMVDDNNNGKQVRLPITDDPTLSRKLRPLMPRLSGNTTPARGTIPYSTMSTSPCFCTKNPNTILPLWNQYPTGGVIGDYGVRGETDGVPLVSTRWNPTPEQLQALEEMYKRGTRTPTAQQIQHIAARLRRFGKIEGKNVFYWFQNHKARERQKKRRQLELLAAKEARKEEAKQAESSTRHFEIEHSKILQPPSEDSVSMHGSVIAACKKLDVWTQVAHKELQSASNDITSWKLDLSYSYNNHSLQASSSGQENTKPLFTSDLVLKENRTLELFPMGRQEENHDSITLCLGNKWRPSEFIEFLPIPRK